MATETQQQAQRSLALLESEFIQYGDEERNEIEALRGALRNLVHKYGSTACLAVIATGFEIAMREKQ